MKAKSIGVMILAMSCSSAFGGHVMGKDALKAEQEQIKARYKADSDRCKGLSGNAKDVCNAEASARQKIARSELEAHVENTPKAREVALIARADAIYDVESERCDDLAGQKKNVCMQEAKSTRDKARADAKAERQSANAQGAANEKIADARKEAGDTKRDADYRVAMERCDTFAGERKDVCVKDAKARFGK